MTQDEIFSAVQSSLVDALFVDEEEVTPEATIMGDLGAESIDLLDVLFRLEKKVGIKIQASDLAARIQGGIPDEEFADENGIISARGLAHLKEVMPQIDTEALAGNFEAEKSISLFTVQNLADMYYERALV